MRRHTKNHKRFCSFKKSVADNSGVRQASAAPVHAALELSALKSACEAYGIETEENDDLEILKARVIAHTFEAGQLNVSNISKDKLQQIALCYEIDFKNTTTKAELETMILNAQNKE